jgi:radial spoke head protein 9
VEVVVLSSVRPQTFRGAYIVEASRKIAKATSSYEGLTYEAAGDLRNFYHFRSPESPEAIDALSRKGLVRHADFLDPVIRDKPKGVWSVARDTTHTLSVLRNHAWPGYYFITRVGGPEYAGVYFGNGLQNPDLAVML